MTRETKIGLLVGLAFIIVIGILLSDHLTSSTEPPPAAIAQAGQGIRSSVATPAGQPQQPPVTVIQPPPTVPPQNVPTANDLSPKPQPVTMVQITPPAQQQAGPVTIASNDLPGDDVAPTTPANPQIDLAQNTQLAQTPAVARPEPATPLTPAPANFAGPRQNDPVLARLNGEAARFGETLLPVGGDARTTATTPPTAAATAATAGGTKYKAEPGDTLSRIAGKFYGSSAKANLDAIVAANPSLKDNPNLIIEGRTYTIPAAPAGAAAAPTATAARPAPATPAAATTATPTPAATASAAAVHVVVEGDNLTRIAVQHLGTPEGVAAIKELNRDLLKGSDVIRPGMKLRLPTRVAAN